MKKLRIRHDDMIVCYDAANMTAAARAAFSFRHFGARYVRIIDGGLKKWLTEQKPIYSGSYSPGQGLPDDENDLGYKILDEERVISDIKQIHNIAYYLFNKATDWQVIDTRPE